MHGNFYGWSGSSSTRSNRRIERIGGIESAIGLFGGKDAGLNFIDLVYPDGKKYRTTTKDLVTGVAEGTVWYQHASGGGGYGDPKQRSPEKVAYDVKNGVVSLKSAKEDYGGVVDPTTLELDEKATADLRKK